MTNNSEDTTIDEQYFDSYADLEVCTCTYCLIETILSFEVRKLFPSLK